LGEQTKKNIWRLFEATDSELEKISQFFFSRFNPFPSLPSAATEDSK